CGPADNARTIRRRVSRRSAGAARAGTYLPAPVDRPALRHSRTGARADGGARAGVLREPSQVMNAHGPPPVGLEEFAMSVSIVERSLSDRAVEVLRRAGNPFRNYFARNPDDEV